MLTHLAATLAGALSHLVAAITTLVAHAPSAAHAAPFLFATAPAVAGTGGGDGTGGDDDADDDAFGEETQSIADVGKDILAGLTEDEKKRQLSEDDDEKDEPAGGADAVDDDEEDEPAEEDEELDDDDEDDVDDETDDTKKGKGKDGAKDGAKPDAEATDADADAPKAIKVTLPGIEARGEDDLNIEIDDPEVAERIRRLKNDGLRLKSYESKVASVEDREAKLEAYADQMDTDPISFHLNRMTTEQQIDVAKALVIEHLDAILPELDKLVDDPKARADARIKLRDDMKKSQEQFELQREVKLHSQRCIRAVDALVPVGTDEETVNEFNADARQILAAAAKRGERVTPETVATILAKRMKLYGFDKKPKSRKPSAPVKPAVPEKARAKPVSDKAREIAERKPGNGKPATSATESRIRRTQAARAAGSRVAPAGAGAAPVQAMALPPEAETDVEAMSKYLRGQKLPDSWKTRDD